jgi:trichodiene synthase
MENWMVFVNDLLSFYKEYDDPRDQTSLIMNYCKTYNLTVDEGLEKLTQDTLHSCEQMMAVFSDKDPQLMETIESFMHGYVTWHLCDKRYRLPEIYAEVTGDSEVEVKFRKYCEQAYAVGSIEPTEWAYPSISDIIEQNKKEEELKTEQATDVVEKLVSQTESVEVVH